MYIFFLFKSSANIKMEDQMKDYYAIKKKKYFYNSCLCGIDLTKEKYRPYYDSFNNLYSKLVFN